jgi:hypothetical protein
MHPHRRQRGTQLPTQGIRRERLIGSLAWRYFGGWNWQENSHPEGELLASQEARAESVNPVASVSVLRRKLIAAGINASLMKQ